ncbi:MAG: hypothetical protein AB7F66_13035 [Bacteriovoracia bacterium]
MTKPMGSKSIAQWILIGTAAVSATLPQNSFGWGHVGHQIVAETGSQLANQFWSSNAGNLGVLTNVPDNTWKSGRNSSIEKPTHYFEPDSYFDNPADFTKFPRRYEDAVAAYGQKTLVEYGTAVWRIQQFYTLAVNAAKSGDFKTAVEMAGAMSHYVGDLAQPLHTTENYDGQKTGNKGIHKFFETDNLETVDFNDLKAEVLKRATKLLGDAKFTSQFQTGKTLDHAFVEVNRAYQYKDQVIGIDLKLGRSGDGATQQLDLAMDRMADGAATLAMFLRRAWKEADLQDQAMVIRTSTPSWVAPRYSNQFGLNFDAVAQSNALSLEEEILAIVVDHDDCYEHAHE